MTNISLQIPGKDLKISTRYAAYLHLSRAEYIREAVRRLNSQIEAQQRAKRMADVSRRVRKESMKINAEFAAFEKDPDA